MLIYLWFLSLFFACNSIFARCSNGTSPSIYRFTVQIIVLFIILCVYVCFKRRQWRCFAPNLLYLYCTVVEFSVFFLLIHDTRCVLGKRIGFLVFRSCYIRMNIDVVFVLYVVYCRANTLRTAEIVFMPYIFSWYKLSGDFIGIKRVYVSSIYNVALNGNRLAW